MALQQVVPFFEPAGGLGADPPRPLRRMARPVPVSFRRGGSLKELISVISANPSVQIDASAGAGKSTVVPGEILAAIGGMLLHMLPSQFLANELYKYVSKTRTDCILIDDVPSKWPDGGWVFTSAAVVEASMLASGKMELPECVLYHDEVHRSDCYTYLVNKQWGSIRGVKKYVIASATSGVDGFRKLESAGVVEVAKFDSALTEVCYDVHGTGENPWDICAISGNTLVFEDRSDFANYLVSEYAKSGFEVYRLHSRMKPRVFESAMHSLASPGITVLVADSTFRDGYTFDLTCTIDSGKVQTTSVVDGQPARVLRDAFEGEVYQGGARGGRTSGSRMVSWRPDKQLLKKRVALEEVEMDAVALISRLLSTLVPLEATESVMAEGMVPNDLVGSLRGTQPLACLASTQLVALHATGYVRAPSPVLKEGCDVRTPGMDYQFVGVSADRANQYHFGSFAGSESTSSAPKSESTYAAGTSVSSDWTGEIASWAAEAAGEEAEVENGFYYYSPAVKPGVVASAAFPEGWASVVRLAGRSDGLLPVKDMDHSSRNVAIAAGLQRFNILSCERNAIASVAKDVKALGRTRSAPLVHSWMNQLLEKANAVSIESVTVARCLAQLVAGFCTLRRLPDDCLNQECSNLASQLFASLRDIPVADVPLEEAAEHLRGSIPRVSMVPGPAPVVRGAQDARYVEMAYRGHASRAKPPLSGVGKWVVGYNHNASVRRVADRHG